MTLDCNKKRAIFISKIHSLNQEFYFINVILKFFLWIYIFKMFKQKLHHLYMYVYHCV